MTSPGAGFPSRRRVVLQLVGFAVGVGLLAWCIMLAVRGEGWSRVARADPWLLAGLAACSLVSLFVNGSIFWVVLRPVRRLPFADLQWINLVVALLNYAPVRLGLIVRVTHHVRVDGLSLLQVGSWLAAVAYTLALALGACIVATVARPAFDAAWGALVAVQILVGGLLTWVLMRHRIVERHGKGLDRMLGRPAVLAGAVALRLVDIAAFVGRMACAAAILELSLAVADTALLGLAAITLSLNPIGRAGFREAAVAFVASRLVATNVSPLQLESDMATLALVESAGEAIVFVPCGAVALLWFKKKWTTKEPPP